MSSTWAVIGKYFSVLFLWSLQRDYWWSFGSSDLRLSEKLKLQFKYERKHGEKAAVWLSDCVDLKND